MMYWKKQPAYQASIADLRVQRRVLVVICIILLAVGGLLGTIVARNMDYEAKVATQIEQRMYSASVSAVDEVNRLGSIVTSNVNARLARVRQYIYYMEQLNAISISLAGGDGGRIVPESCFTDLYADLDNFENLLQQSTSTTLDARNSLLIHLQALQTYLK